MRIAAPIWVCHQTRLRITPIKEKYYSEASANRILAIRKCVQLVTLKRYYTSYHCGAKIELHVFKNGMANWSRRSVTPRVICADSESALESLSSCKCSAQLILSDNDDVSLVWEPRQSGILGNEEADKLARKNSEAGCVGPKPMVGLGSATKLEASEGVFDEIQAADHQLPSQS